MSRILTDAQVEIATAGAQKRWVEPISVQSVPTPEDMATWYPDPAPEKVRFRWEQNVTTGERKAIELTLDEYRARHVAEIISRNEWFLRNKAKKIAAKRAALLEAFIDTLEK